MTDINKELQKLKALINQKQTTAIFSNKSNESTKLALGDAELYINDMTRKFSFTRAGVKIVIPAIPQISRILSSTKVPQRGKNDRKLFDIPLAVMWR